MQSWEAHYETTNYSWKHEHEALNYDHRNDATFGQPHHPHDSEVKRFGLNTDHQQRVDQQYTQDDEQKDDDVEYQPQKQDSVGQYLHLLQHIHLHPYREEP